MNKTKALLDSLMGPSRNLSKKERTGDDFLQKNVCKKYLIGFCPRSIYGGRIEFLDQKCNKLHSVAMQKEFSKHKDHDKYRKEYEDQCIKLLTEIVADTDAKAAREERKKKPPETCYKIDQQQKEQLKAYEETQASLLVLAEQRRNNGDGPGAEDAEHEASKAGAKVEELRKGHALYFPGEAVCEACGDRYLKANFGDRYMVNNVGEADVINFSRAISTHEDHLEKDSHKCMVQIRKKLKEMRDKRMSEGGPEPSDKRDKEKDRSRSRSRGREKGRSDDEDDRKRRRDDDEGDRGKKGRDRRRDDSRGDRRKGSRGREKSYDDRARGSRGRDDSRDRGNDRYRDWDRGSQRRRDDRSRSNDRYSPPPRRYSPPSSRYSPPPRRW